LDAASKKGELRNRKPTGEGPAALGCFDNRSSTQSLDEYFNEWLRFKIECSNAVSRERRRYPEFTLSDGRRKCGGNPIVAAESPGLEQWQFIWSCSRQIRLLELPNWRTLYKTPRAPSIWSCRKFPAGRGRTGSRINGTRDRFWPQLAGPWEKPRPTTAALGLFVREQLLCKHCGRRLLKERVNTPLGDQLKDMAANRGGQAHVREPPSITPLAHTASHTMDPIGLGLESSTAIGLAGGDKDKKVLKVRPPDRTPPGRDRRGPSQLRNLRYYTQNGSASMGGPRSPVCTQDDCIWVRRIFRYAIRPSRKTNLDSGGTILSFREFRGFRVPLQQDLLIAQFFVRGPRSFGRTRR